MKKQYIFLAVVLFSFVSCSDLFLENDYKGGDWFYLENDGAIMPVWVRGNTASKTFIVFLHGGPGNSSMTYGASPAHVKLQNDYGLVYYDQRGSGMAQGNPKPETFTVAQFTEDLDKIITLIKYKYDCRSIFLLGKSWGGAFGTAYLLDSKRQGRVTGWIIEDGAYDFKMAMPLSVKWVKDKAQKKIGNGDNAGYWRSEIDWYNGNPDLFETSNLMRHGKNLNDLNGIYLNPDNDPGNFFSFASPVPVFYQLSSLYLTNHNNFDMKNISYTGDLDKITIPALILWGRHDGTLPVDLAENAWEIWKTQINKHIKIFENSAHCPSFEEPELWLNTMRGFIDAYK